MTTGAEGERTTGLAADPISRTHETGFGHPECPDRFEAVMSALRTSGLEAGMLPLESRPAGEDALLACHTQEYLDIVKDDVSSGAVQLRTGDTTLCGASLDAARFAAGSVLSAVDAVASGVVTNALCVGRPPGHHATRDAGMGFCIFNNIALGARYAQANHGLERVLIVDWDVHHGNGTQDIFYEDGTVFYFSTHQSPWYPGTGSRMERGRGVGEGTTLNCPFQAGAGRGEILGAFRNELLPAADAFKPDLVMISAGFDSREADPLGMFVLDDRDFADLTSLMMDIAARHAGGRLVSTLEGGYDLNGLASAVVAHAGALAGTRPVEAQNR